MKVSFEFDISNPEDLRAFKAVFANVIGQAGTPPTAPAPQGAPATPASASPAAGAAGKAATPPPPPPKPPAVSPPPPTAPETEVDQGVKAGAEPGTDPHAELRDLLQEYSDATNAVTCATFLRKELKYPNVGSIPEDKIAECIAKTQEKLAALALA